MRFTQYDVLDMKYFYCIKRILRKMPLANIIGERFTKVISDSRVVG